MDPKTQRIIETMRRSKKPDNIWNRGQQMSQPIFSYQEGKWQEYIIRDASVSIAFSRISILSWNIDFMRTLPSERMQVALDFLRGYIDKISNPVFLMLNEMLVSDLDLIQTQPWVRDQFFLTDITNEYWESGHYGTCVLIPRSVLITQVFRVHYEDTAMERDALFVDLASGSKTVRICSTHLESLIANPPKRPSQLATAARFMHQAEASILGGDLNAIEPFDKNLHSDNNLKDAYLVMGGKEDDERGMTWGQMAPTRERKRFGLTRMDKLYFSGAIEVDMFESFGLDVVLEDSVKAREMMEEEGLEKPWVTDHLGVRGDFRVIGGSDTANL